MMNPRSSVQGARAGSTRRHALVLLAGAGAASRLAGCARSGAKGERVLKIANQKAGTKALLQAAGLLADVPYRIEWSEFPAAGPMLQALAAGAADTASVGDEPFIFAYASGAPIKVVRALRTVGPGSLSALLVKPASALRRPQDLAGRAIGTVQGSTGHYVALKVVERAGLRPADVRMVYLSNGDARAALDAGSIDAWATWGTYVALAVVEKQARVLADSQGLRTNLAFHAATDAAIADKRDLLADFLARHRQGQAWAHANREAYVQVLAGETGLPPEVLRFTYNRTNSVIEPITPELQTEEAGVLATFRAAGLPVGTPDLSRAFDASFNV